MTTTQTMRFKEEKTKTKTARNTSILLNHAARLVDAAKRLQLANQMPNDRSRIKCQTIACESNAAAATACTEKAPVGRKQNNFGID
jgi:hypothetical protein